MAIQVDNVEVTFLNMSKAQFVFELEKGHEVFVTDENGVRKSIGHLPAENPDAPWESDMCEWDSAWLRDNYDVFMVSRKEQL